jgi:hypothetical protein
VFDRFVKLPPDLLNAARDVERQNPALWNHTVSHPKAATLPTSLDMLEPNSPALMILAAHEPPQGVHRHSIIGAVFGQGSSSTDGVVPYSSSHISGVDSEILVPASHLRVHDHPQAVLEVRRILRVHLQEFRGGQVIQIGAGQTR